MEKMTQDIRDTIAEALYKTNIHFEIEEENGCLLITTEEGRCAIIRSSKQSVALNVGLLRWAIKEGFSEEQANDLPAWIPVDNLGETIKYLQGKHFKMKGKHHAN